MSIFTQNILADLNESGEENFEEGEEEFEVCGNCSRKFFIGRLALHLKSCTQEKPYKPAAKPGQQRMNVTDSILKRLKNDSILEKTKEENNDNELCECNYCGRTFFPERIEKHQSACEKHNRKPKTTSSNSQRMKGSIFPNHFNTSDSQQRKASREDSNNSTMGSTRSKWRIEHERFLKSIRKWKKNKPESSDSRNDEEIDEYADYVQCQFCLRRFAPSSTFSQFRNS